jgi:hypothetical protein
METVSPSLSIAGPLPVPANVAEGTRPAAANGAGCGVYRSDRPKLRNDLSESAGRRHRKCKSLADHHGGLLQRGKYENSL